jgi:hypothetical protein
MADAENKQPNERSVAPSDLGWKDLPALAPANPDPRIAWYLVNKVPQKWWARKIRLAVIVFTTIGGLIPLIAASKVLARWTDGIEFSQFGYISLALAGACIGLDRYFGFSSAWIRYLTTATMLQRLLHEFCLDWAILDTCHEGGAPEQIEPMLRRIQIFVTRVRSELEKETADWAAEYRSNLAEMEKSMREQLEASRPGSVSVTVTNVSKAGPEGVTVFLNGASMQKITTPDCLLSPVFPGEHVVTIRGTIGNTPRSVSTEVRVEPGRPYLLTLKLPEDNP